MKSCILQPSKLEVFMTREQFESYLPVYDRLINRVSPEKQDAYQDAMCKLLHTYEHVECESAEHFKNLISSRADNIGKQTYSNTQRSLKSADVEIVHLEDEQFKQIPSNDGAALMRERVLEYIELLPKVYRPIFLSHYVDGVPLKEIAAENEITPARVTKMIDEGVQWIKDELSASGEL
jgi:RNA polymerase sigma factor (sigma-70 family)